jgi:hypothetical protein
MPYYEIATSDNRRQVLLIEIDDSPHSLKQNKCHSWSWAYHAVEIHDSVNDMASAQYSLARFCVDAHSASDFLPLMDNRSFRVKIGLMKAMTALYYHLHMHSVQRVSMDVVEIGKLS